MKPFKMRPNGRPGRGRYAPCIAALAALGTAATVHADVKLASVFGPGMVIQRDLPAWVWGTASPNATVTLQLGRQNATASADAKGNWAATVQPQPAGGPFTLTVSDSRDTQVELKDVYLGDVWICSGQSNMQMSLGEADNGPATAAMASEHQMLRLCKIGQAWTDTPQSSVKAEWQPANPQSASKFSAVGYFFGNELLKSPQLADVPLGLIEADLGGTLAEAWAPKDELAGIDPKKIEKSMFGIGPTTLYNGMIAPLGQMGVKGVIWYQGEGNAGDPASYPAKLSAVIRGWRKQFNNPDLPFLIVQLPDYAPAWGGYYWQWLREAQRQVATSLKSVGLVTSINTNDGLDLHPKPKETIGQRAALLARQDVYGEKIVGHGPVLKSVQAGGDSIQATFDTDGSALTAVDPKHVRGFLVAGDDGEYRRAEAMITGDDTVTVKSDLVPTPKTVRYAWAGVPMSTLANNEGLPAYPFRTDALPMDSFGLQPQAAARMLKSKDCELVIVDGYITSFTIHSQQFLSNETGPNMGVNMPSFLGPRGFGKLTELGPDLVQLGEGDFTLQLKLGQSECTWTARNNGKDPETIRVNLSPLVKASDVQNGDVTLTRRGATVKVSGVNNVGQSDGLTWLEIKAPSKATTVVHFGLGTH